MDWETDWHFVAMSHCHTRDHWSIVKCRIVQWIVKCKRNRIQNKIFKDAKRRSTGIKHNAINSKFEVITLKASIVSCIVHPITVLSLIYALPLIIAHPPYFFSGNRTKNSVIYCFLVEILRKNLQFKTDLALPFCVMKRKWFLVIFFIKKLQYLTKVLSQRGGVC